MKNIFSFFLIYQILLLTGCMAFVNAGGEPEAGELERFVHWSVGAKLTSLSPEKLRDSLKPYNFEVEETYNDKRYRFLRGYPHFIDGVLKFRYQRSGGGDPKDQWELLDAIIYFPGLSQMDIEQILQKLEISLGKPVKTKQNDMILTMRWMIGEFDELSMRVDKEAGNLSLTFSVLQGDAP
ncbi:MAG: hypothetical protein OEZ43_15730 [Gammaproteobacteria bacterium]|nr:hypothetical protein [Gammaproteobacteria bacterium]